jgi:hypothetical protein
VPRSRLLNHPILATSSKSSVPLSKFTAVDDSGRFRTVDLARLTASVLDGLDNCHGLLVGNLTKDNMLAIEPLGLDSGDEELGAIPVNS